MGFLCHSPQHPLPPRTHPRTHFTLPHQPVLSRTRLCTSAGAKSSPQYSTCICCKIKWSSASASSSVVCVQCVCGGHVPLFPHIPCVLTTVLAMLLRPDHGLTRISIENDLLNFPYRTLVLYEQAPVPVRTGVPYSTGVPHSGRGIRAVEIRCKFVPRANFRRRRSHVQLGRFFEFHSVRVS